MGDWKKWNKTKQSQSKIRKKKEQRPRNTFRDWDIAHTPRGPKADVKCAENVNEIVIKH